MSNVFDNNGSAHVRNASMCHNEKKHSSDAKLSEGHHVFIVLRLRSSCLRFVELSMTLAKLPDKFCLS